MKNPFSSNLSESTRRRVELATAVAQERLLSTHVDHALRLIQLLGDRVSFEAALGIYTRLLRLSDDETRVVTTRALAILGEQATESSKDYLDEIVEAPEPDGNGGSASFLTSMRHRLRGRVKDDLRRWVELAAARAEVAIMNTHTDNALNFVDLLQNDIAPADAVQLYLEALEVRDSVAEVTYYNALGRIADEELPDGRSGSVEPRRVATAGSAHGDAD